MTFMVVVINDNINVNIMPNINDNINGKQH